MLVYQAVIMTHLHHISIFFLFLSLSLSLTTTSPLAFGLNQRPPVPPPYRTPEPVPPKSTPPQPLTPQSINRIENPSNTSNTNSYDCFKTSPFAPDRPNYYDCLDAIRLLPSDPTKGQFQSVENLHLALPNLIH